MAAELPKRLKFYLPHRFSGKTHLVADVFQGVLFTSVELIPVDQNTFFAILQIIQNPKGYFPGIFSE